MNKDFDFTRFQLALPRTGSLLFAGAALYIGFIDPHVRLSHQSEKQQLIHWLTMYNKSKWVMGPCAFASTLFGINGYRLTNDKLWLVGSLVCFSILPFTLLAIMGINKKLAQDEEASRKGVVNQGIASRLAQWVCRHRVRAFLSLIAAGIFYMAEVRSSGD